MLAENGSPARTAARAGSGHHLRQPSEPLCLGYGRLPIQTGEVSTTSYSDDDTNVQDRFGCVRMANGD